MATPSFSIPDTELHMVEDILQELEYQGDRPRGHSRSAEIRTIMRRYISAHEDELRESRDWDHYEAYLATADWFDEPADG